MTIQQMMFARSSALTYATWNPSAKNANVTLSGGNLTAVTSIANNSAVQATIGKSSGKWYWEITGANNVGIGDSAQTFVNGDYPGSQTTTYGYNKTAIKINNGSSSAYGATFTGSDVIGVALDMDAGTLEFLKNNVSQGVAFTGLSGTFFPSCSVFAGSFDNCVANFGATAFVYSPPGGFNAGLYN